MGKFQIGNPGREKQFKTPQDLQDSIDSYFKSRDEKNDVYTIESLGLWLGLSRYGLLNYECREGYEAYFDIVKDAKQKVHDQWISKAFKGEGNTSMAIFLLKNNANYSDRIEQNNTSDQTTTFKVDFGK